jgi:hypothetical protein
MMHGLARRQIDKRQQHPSGFPPVPADPNNSNNSNLRMPIPGSSNASVASTAPRPNNSNNMSDPNVPNKPTSRKPRSRSSSPSNSINTHRSSVNSSSAPVAPLPNYNNGHNSAAGNNGNKITSPIKFKPNNSNSSVNNGSFSNANNNQVSELIGRSPKFREKANTSLQSISSQKQQQLPQQLQGGQQQYVQDLNFSDDYTLSEKVSNTNTSQCVIWSSLFISL